MQHTYQINIERLHDCLVCSSSVHSIDGATNIFFKIVGGAICAVNMELQLTTSERLRDLMLLKFSKHFQTNVGGASIWFIKY